MKVFPVVFLGLLMVLIQELSGPLRASSPIPVRTMEKQPDGVVLHMQPGLLRVQVCTDRIIRVTYSPTDALPATLQDFVVTRSWTPVPFDLKDNPADVTVSTGKVTVRMDRASGQVQFLDAKGAPLLQEMSGGGKTMTPATVNGEQSYQPEQSFTSPDDEVLYGLGQGQEGIWNWRGMPRQLLQHNTDIALPILISNKGYGLFWNNAAITQVNPADAQVQIDPATHTGSYTTKDAGDYVFFVKDGDRRDEIGVNVEGRDLGDIKNMWVPYAVAGKIKLEANKTCAVKLLGGGRDAKVFARPLGNLTTFRSEVGDAIDYYFFYGPELDDVVANFRLATGAAPLFPKWAYGFWQCRERYSSQDQLLAAAAEFRKRQIPVDLIIQDWQYWGKYGWGAYQFDETKYPDPAAMIKTLHDENIKYMISVWSDPAGEVQDELRKIDALVPDKPKVPSWMDVYNPEARKIRWEYMDKAFFSIGTDAWWQDATEPGDPGRVLLGKKTFLGSGNRYNNAYPFFASMATYEGQRSTTSEKRVCILTRSGYPGQQRFGAAVWSGDINGNWMTLKRQIAGGLNLSVTGLPYWTTDCAGFFHPKDQYTSPDYNELLVRWFQFSTFSPIQRIHGYQTETEMWKWLPKTQEQLLAYDKLRHRLLPYAYSVAWKVTHEGYTILRPLVMDFRTDPKAQRISDEFMYGPAFLVAPVTVAQATSRDVYLPTGSDWINFWTGEKVTGGRTVSTAAPVEQIPLYVRAGSIIPFGPDVQYATEKPADPIVLRVYPGADGSFTLYEDEDDNYNYEKGAYATIPFTWSEQNKSLTLGARNGQCPGMLDKRTFHAVFVSTDHGTGLAPTEHPDQETSYNGQTAILASGTK
jgi:alpha-D-xyloside xylohydrolase